MSNNGSDSWKQILEEGLRYLKLTTILRLYAEEAEQLGDQAQLATHFLASLVDVEVQEKMKRSLRARISAAGFPTIKTIDAFDWTCPASTTFTPRIDSAFMLLWHPLLHHIKCYSLIHAQGGSMKKEVKRELINEYVRVVRERYQGSSTKEKSIILDEFVSTTGYHRKHAIRLMRAKQETATLKTRVSKRIYDFTANQNGPAFVHINEPTPCDQDRHSRKKCLQFALEYVL